MATLSLQDILFAVERIKPFIYNTPILVSSTLNEMFGTKLFFKCENYQRTGAFKFRGACNAVFSLDETEAKRGVATHSSGNHAAALACAGKLRGIPVHVVIPENAPAFKIQNTQQFGASITYCKANLTSREETLDIIMKKTGATLIHPYNDDRVIAGQGTAAVELLEKIPDLDLIMTPVGGGGLLSGTAIAGKAIHPDIAIFGAEPKGADDAFRSLQAGKIIPQIAPQTIADGLLSSLGTKTFSIIQQYVNEIITVSESNIVRSIQLMKDKLGVTIEPSSAVAIAALLENPLPHYRKIGMIISGGNVADV